MKRIIIFASIILATACAQAQLKIESTGYTTTSNTTVTGKTSSTLMAGMYIYALIIDGQMVASKRMVLTE